MKPSGFEFANRIGQALICASNHSRPTRSWIPSLEQTLHRLGCRASLTPSLVAMVIDPVLISHHSLALGFFNWASQQPGFVHNALSYQSIFKSLSISRQFKAINGLLKQVKAQNINLNSSVYRSIIASQILGRQTMNAFFIFNEVVSMNQDIGTETCNSLLAALASDGYFEYAHNMLDEMIQKGISLSTLGFGLFIWRIVGKTELGKVLSVLDVVKKGSLELNGSVIALLIIHGLCRASRMSDALWVIDKLRSRDCKPDFMAYSILVEAFRSTGNVADTEKVLKKKRKLGVAPRAADYRELILALVSERRVCEAKELGWVIVHGNFPIDDDVLNVLIGSVSTIDPGSAIAFLKFMIGKERFPTLLTLSNLSRSLCKHGMTNELLELYQVLSSNDYFSDNERCNVIISFLCKAGKVKEAYGAIQEMRKKGLGLDVTYYNSLMEACCREDLLRPAKRLWDEMFASGCSGNLKTYNILINKLTEVGQIKEAQRLFHHMLEREIAPDAATYMYLLEGLCKERKLEAAFEVFNKSVKQDSMLARTILSKFILCLCKEDQYIAASKLLCGLTYDIGHSDSHVILLQSLVDSRAVPIATEHIKWVQETSTSMLQVIATKLLASLSSSSNPDQMVQLLQTVQESVVSNNGTWKDLCIS